MPIAPIVQALLMTALPGGGQRTARRNAWAAQCAAASRARARREAGDALDAAVHIARQKSRTGA